MTLPKKRATPWGKTLRAAQGSIEIPESLYSQDFSESAPAFESGRAGSYFFNEMTERRLVADDGELRESSFAESGTLTSRKLTANQKVLWNLVKGQCGGELSVNQRTALSRWLAVPKHIEIALVLNDLRNKTGMSNTESIKKMTYEVHAQEMMTSLTRLLRSE